MAGSCPGGTRHGEFGLLKAVVTLRAMTPTLKITALAVGLAFVLASCGGGSAGAVTVEMAEFSFNPDSWTLAGAGDEITIEFDNTGTVIHNWALVKLGQEITREGDLPEDPAERGDLYLVQFAADPGESVSETFTLPAAGTYQVICDIQAHFSAGMAGTLTVSG